jgi:tetratricopeptide (TPR) repeat protein
MKYPDEQTTTDPVHQRKVLFVPPGRVFGFLASCVLVPLFLCASAYAEGVVPEAEITSLQQELSQAAGASSTAQSRRVCKSVIRQAQALLKASPDATNRFAVLGLIHDGQKRLLSLENTEENRNALFASAEELRKAPDEYAELRLGADLLLMEKAMGEKKATTAERSKVLEELLASYRGTPAESKSLMIGSMIATKLLDLELVDRINRRLQESSAGDHQIIQKWRTDSAGDRFDAVFQGIYRTVKGDSVSLPFDYLGHQYMVIFWSEKNPRIDDLLREAKELQSKHPGGLQVLSFNLDDGVGPAEEKLKSLGLDWTALLLPGGRESSTFRAYAGIEPQAFIVNAQGRVLLDSPSLTLGITGVEGGREEAPGARKISEFEWQIDDSRYLAQLRSLFIGDFLVADAPKSTSIPTDVMEQIQACFVQPPFRYRLSRDEEMANYRKAVDLCDAALKAQPDSPDGWMLRNRKIIALIGLSKVSAGVGEFAAARGRCGDQITHLDVALGEAKPMLVTTLPPGADVVARFCLAKAALRRGGANPEALISDFLEKSGGEKAPPSALAAAAILALEGNAKSSHETYRELFLALGDKIDAGLWPVRAFLLDRHHRHRNFFAVPGGTEERKGKYGFRNMLSGLAEPLDRDTRVSLELKKPDGGVLTIPKDMPKRILGVVFAEPPANADEQGRLIERAKGFAGIFKNHGVDVVVALLTDDTKWVKAVAPDDNSFQVAMVPGGLKNPLVQKLGILSADRMPNVLLFRPDGTLAWTVSWLSYQYVKKQEGSDYPMNLAIGNNIEKAKCDLGFEALERGDYKTALKLFDEFAPQHKKGNWWYSDRDHGRALAYMGLKDWETALTAIDTVIPQRNRAGVCKCHGVVEMFLTKAMILDKLGRGGEAEAARALADQQTLPHSAFPSGAAFRTGVPVGVYYDWLKRIRLGMEGAKAETGAAPQKK